MYYDALEEIEDNIPERISPNELYDPKYTVVATFNSITDVNQFCNTYNHNNGYNGLKLGQRIQINDGVYNKVWLISGFDMEHNQTAADGSIYDNGYGICLIPYGSLLDTQWHGSNISIAYMNSDIHILCNNTIINNLKNILENHLVYRNALLCNNTNKYNGAISYTWTKAYVTLPSMKQVNVKTTEDPYDIGESNYILPLYNFERFAVELDNDIGTWFRYSSYYVSSQDKYYTYYMPYQTAMPTQITNTGPVRPVIYIR